MSGPAAIPLHEEKPTAFSQTTGTSAGRYGALLLVLLCLLPFSNKPVHIDDPLFIWIANQIQRRWWDFFGGSINWYGSPMHPYQVMLNPPLTSYYLAGAMRLLGSSERALHLAMLLPALATTAGIYKISTRFCSCPALATAMAVLSPAFLVSATTLMSDGFMLCLWVWALVAWVAGVRERRQGLLCLASLLVLAAALAKYFAACLLPLMVVDALIVWRGFRWELAWLLLPIAGLLGYQAYTSHLYGSGLLGFAMSYSVSERSRELGSSRPRILTGLSFVGGCMLTAVPAAVTAAAVLLREIKPVGRWAVLAAVAVGYGVLLRLDVPVIARFTHRASLPPAELLQLVLFSLAAIPILGVAVGRLWYPQRPGTLMLAFWVLGTFTFVVWFNWTVNGRTVLPMTPAVAILAVQPFSPRQRWPWLAVVPLAVMSLSAAFADQSFARSVRDASNHVQIRVNPDASTVWFEGHWGFQYYMQQWGAKPIDASRTRCLPGQLLVVPSFNSSGLAVPPVAVELLERFAPPQCRWINTMAPDVGAGFYSDVCGPLPFAFGLHESDPYDVLGVQHSIQYSQKAGGRLGE